MLLTIITIHTANEKWNFLDAEMKKMYLQGNVKFVIILSAEMWINFWNGISTLQITLHSTSILQQWKEECHFLRYDNPKFHWRIVHCSLLCIHKMVWSAHSMSLQLFILNHTNTWSRVFENRIKWNSVQNNFWHDVICQEFTWSILLWFWIIGNKYVTL